MKLEDLIVLSTQRTSAPLTMRTPSEIIRAVGTVTHQQHQEIERLAERTNSAPGDLLRLARECSQDGGVTHITEIDRFAASEMIDVLEAYERVIGNVERRAEAFA